MFTGGLVTTLGMPALHSAVAHCVQWRTGNHLGDARFTFRVGSLCSAGGLVTTLGMPALHSAVAHCVQRRTGNHLGDAHFTFRGDSLCSVGDW